MRLSASSEIRPWGGDQLLAFAELVSEVHWSRGELAGHSPLPLTSLRATGMAIAFARLLRLSIRHPVLQSLRPHTAQER